MNLYAYVRNDPVNAKDPNGEFAVALPLVIPALVKAGEVTIFVTSAIIAGAGVNEIIQMMQDDSSENQGSEPTESPEIDPKDIAGNSPEEIDKIAKDKGLIPKGPNPQEGQGSYIDPVTGKQRILVHPDADGGGHCHVNDCDGNRLDEDGNEVPDESPDAHLPIDTTI